MSRRRKHGPYKMYVERHHDASQIRALIADMIHGSGKKRSEIAAEMATKLQEPVTERMLLAFTAQSKELHRWPAQFDIAFCEVVGSYELLQQRVKRAGFRMIGAKEEQLIKLGRAYLAQAKAQKRLMEGISL